MMITIKRRQTTWLLSSVTLILGRCLWVWLIINGFLYSYIYSGLYSRSTCKISEGFTPSYARNLILIRCVMEVPHRERTENTRGCVKQIGMGIHFRRFHLQCPKVVSLPFIIHPITTKFRLILDLAL